MSSKQAGTARDTIAACATARGAGALAIVRVSGPDALALAERVAGPDLVPRKAALRRFRDKAGVTIDSGLVLCFSAPASFTGEDVVELHCHGSAVVVDWLLDTLCRYGARPAEPGEFSLRAFLNGKLDLTQAEGIADLIESGSRAAAQAALRSLEGRFADAVNDVQAALTDLRVLCEAYLDFPEEELDAPAADALNDRVSAIDGRLADIEAIAGQGLRLTDGLKIAIAGEPNAGKSSLLNRLAGVDAAIVSQVPGTTRDVLERQAVVAGLPVELTDTAGLRETTDEIETEGVSRARRAIACSDIVLWVADVRAGAGCARQAAREALPADCRYMVLLNKIDLVTADSGDYVSEADITGGDDGGARDATGLAVTLSISALTGQGIDRLIDMIGRLGGVGAEAAGAFSARRRHLAALATARNHVRAARPLLAQSPELAAEELRMAQTALGELTGEVTSDDLLGRIFSTFCIGK